MTGQKNEDLTGTWEDEIKEEFKKNIQRPLQDLVDGSTDMSIKMDIGIAFAILIGELQRQNKRIEDLENEVMRE